MITDLRIALVNRACAATKDTRAQSIGKALGLDAGPAWIIARLEEQPHGLTRYGIRQRLPRTDNAILRSGPAIGPIMSDIRDTLGHDAVFTDLDGYRLTPLGRIRIRIALGEPVV